MHKFFQRLVPLSWTFILCCLVSLTCSAIPSSAYSGSAGNDPLKPEICGQLPLAVDVPSSAKTPEEARPFFDHIDGIPITDPRFQPQPPFDPLTQSQIDLFKQWMNEGYAP